MCGYIVFHEASICGFCVQRLCVVFVFSMTLVCGFLSFSCTFHVIILEKSLKFHFSIHNCKTFTNFFFFFFFGSSSKLKLWYALAKTLSEQAAWALAMDRMVNMVSINAGLVLGPGVTQQNSRSTMSYLQGRDVLCCNIIHFVT